MTRAMGGLAAGIVALLLGACDPPPEETSKADSGAREAEQAPSGSPDTAASPETQDTPDARETPEAPAEADAATAPETAPPADGTDTPDPWLWLEERKGKKALSWVRRHNERTRRILKGDPRFPVLRQQALSIFTASDRIPYGRYANGFIYSFWQDDEHVRGIYRRATLESYRSGSPEWLTLLDIDKLAKTEGENWVLKGISCLPPAHERCMIALSRGGQDRIVVREWSETERAFVKDGFKIDEGYSQVAWLDRDSLLVSTHRGRSLFAAVLFGYRDQVRVWNRGTPLDEAVPLLETNAGKADLAPAVSHRPEGKVAVIARQHDFYNAEYFVITEEGQMAKLPLPTHADMAAVFKRQLLFVLRKPWSRRTKGGETREFSEGTLISFDLQAFMNSGELPQIRVLHVPEERSRVLRVTTSRDAVLVNVLKNGTAGLKIMTFEDGEWTRRPADVPADGTVSVTSTDNFSNVTFVSYQNFLTPTRLLELDVNTGEVTKLKTLPERFDADGLTVRRLEATSRDGTKVPYFFVGPEGAGKDGPLPTLLFGYGGFGISITPGYLDRVGKLWLEKGGAFAVASIRGGGELGPQWRRAGQRMNRQNSFDDFIAVSEDLIERKFTSPQRLGIMGASNGGLLVGAAFTQRPDLYNAVVSVVPLLDMIRYVKMPPGQIWISEYGDPGDPEERKVLMGYSPYHNLKEDEDYPRVLFITSTSDDRVHPGHARKMAARMEAMGHEVHYYETIEGGHSASANLLQRADNTALEFVYLARRLMEVPPDMPPDDAEAKKSGAKGASAGE